jgi:hypothetical protein
LPDREPGRAAGDRQHDVFDEQLPQQAAAAGADGQADADLTPA